MVAALLGSGIIAVASPAEPAEALSGNDFIPGLIISDSLFYDGNAMTEAQIQQFLVSKGSALSWMTFDVNSRPRSISADTGNVKCEAFTGGSGLLASTIIYRAQAACGISAKVILVTLHKEQGLITKSAPSQTALDRAMGYACPDTAPCAPTTLGFGNQVYAGTVQLNTYKASRFGRQPGYNYIQWHPNADCGGTTVYVQNYATAALYNYTPYQPNAAALANLGTTGDGCSSYGNRNFWTYYSNWFGSPVNINEPHPVTAPVVSGSTAVGATLTMNPGPWTGNPTFGYVWISCPNRPDGILDTIPSSCAVQSGVTTSTYVTTGNDVGRYIAALVTGSNSYGSMTVAAALPSPIGFPENSVRPVVSGSTNAGSTWTLDVGTWTGSPAPTFGIFWLRCSQPVAAGATTVPSGCVAISGANAATYVTTDADLGKYVTAQVAAQNSLGFALSVAVSARPLGFPANVAEPTVSGSSTIGSTWTVAPGTWAGTPAPSYGIFWLRCTQPVASGGTTVPAGCSAIPGANGTTYTTSTADADRYLTAQIAGSNYLGFSLAVAPSATPIESATPANTVPPTVSGSATVGATWTANPGTWSGSPAPTFGYFWLRCSQPVGAGQTTVPSGCAAISGANSPTYVTTSADAGRYLTVQIAGQNPSGFALAVAAASTAITGSVPAAPQNTVAPSVSGGQSVGSTWTVNPGTWSGSPAPTYGYFWLRCSQPVGAGQTTVPSGCSAISGANSATYVTTSADAGRYLTAQIAGSNSLGFSLAVAPNGTALQSGASTVPQNTVAPSVSGGQSVGSTWTVNPGTWSGSPAPTFGYFWLRCSQPVGTGHTTVPSGCSAISGANGTTYVATSADAGRYLTAQIAGSNSSGFSLAVAPSSTAIQSAAATLPQNTAAPSVTGSADAGSTWTVNPGTWSGSPAPTFGYFWLRCSQPVGAGQTTVPSGCAAISGANGTTYVATSADVGRYLTAQIAGSNSSGFSLAVAPSSTAIQAVVPTLPQNTVAPTVTGTASVGATWTVNTGTWTGSPTPTFGIFWLRCNQPQTTTFGQVPSGCVAIDGARSATYVATSADAGKYLTAQIAGQNSVGFTLAGAVSTTAIGG